MDSRVKLLYEVLTMFHIYMFMSCSYAGLFGWEGVHSFFSHLDETLQSTFVSPTSRGKVITIGDKHFPHVVLFGSDCKERLAHYPTISKC